jgi:hypothetical protein
MSVQYRISTLLIITALVAAMLAIGVWTRWADFYFVLAYSMLFAVSGFLAGWFARSGTAAGSSCFMCAIAFVALNWTLWYVNNRALIYVDWATERTLNSILHVMLQAHRYNVFEFIAVAFTVLTAAAMILRDRRLVLILGAANGLFWFLVIAVGYLSTSICMIDLN